MNKFNLCYWFYNINIHFTFGLVCSGIFFSSDNFGNTISCRFLKSETDLDLLFNLNEENVDGGNLSNIGFVTWGGLRPASFGNFDLFSILFAKTKNNLLRTSEYNIWHLKILPSYQSKVHTYFPQGSAKIKQVQLIHHIP